MVDLILRTSVMLLVAWVASRLLTRATAATRHLLWHAAIIAVLAAPLISPLVPQFSVPDMPGAARVARVLVLPEQPHATPADTADPSGTLGTSGPATAVSAVSSLGVPVILWVTGAGLASLWFVSGILAVALLARRSHPAPGPWQEEADSLCHDLGIRARVIVRVMPQGGSPLTTGWFSHSILLPEHAAMWDADRRRTVFLHELAHVRRHDCRTQSLAQIACIVYWFNPLVWVAASALRHERERACDDQVLMHGAQASTYASHLLEIARDLQPRLVSHAAVAMARPRELEGRLLAVLSAGRARVPARGTRWLVALTIAISTSVALGARRESTIARTAPFEPPQAATPAATASEDRMVAILAAALKDPDRQVREKAAMSLALSSTPDVIPLLIEALQDPDAQVREKAALGLALREDPRVVEPLIAAARDEDAQVREKAIMGLGTTGDPRALATLEAAAKDPDAQVREKAITALMLLRTGGPDTRKQIGAGLRTLVGGLLHMVQ